MALQAVFDVLDVNSLAIAADRLCRMPFVAHRFSSGERELRTTSRCGLRDQRNTVQTICAGSKNLVKKLVCFLSLNTSPMALALRRSLPAGVTTARSGLSMIAWARHRGSALRRLIRSLHRRPGDIILTKGRRFRNYMPRLSSLLSMFSPQHGKRRRRVSSSRDNPQQLPGFSSSTMLKALEADIQGEPPDCAECHPR